MTVLVTGAGGFVGLNVCRSLETKFNLIRVFSSEHFESGTTSVNCDLRDGISSLSKLKRIGVSSVDTVIHLANFRGDYDTPPSDELQANIQIASSIGQIARTLGARKILNLSSSSVYPNIDGEFFENSPVNPSVNADAIYGLSKFCTEEIIGFFAKPDILVTHLRSSMINGPGVKDSRIWPTMRSELKNKNTITVFGDGERLINHVSVDFLAEIIVKFLENDHPGVFNVNEETLSILELAKKMIGFFGNKESKIIRIADGNRIQFRVNSSKLKNMI
jgi:nucleoside-diphosphate-sugar epimerase